MSPKTARPSSPGKHGRRRYLVLALALGLGAVGLLVVWLVGGDDAVSSSDAPLRAVTTNDDLLRERPFTITYQVGSGFDGSTTVTIRSSGEVVLQVRAPGMPVEKAPLIKDVRKTVSQETVTNLRLLMIHENMLDLHRGYATSVQDGMVVTFTIEFEDLMVQVVCDNYFPGPIARFHDFIDVELLGASHDLEPLVRWAAMRTRCLATG